MSPIDLLQWWNLIFDLPFVAALIPLLLQATGAAHLGHAGHGVHVGHLGLHGHHVHVPHFGHHHIEAGAHAPSVVHAGHEIAPHAHIHAEHHAEGPGILSRALGLLGIGKVPIMMAFSSFSFVWGFTGVVCNLFFSKVLPVPMLFIWPSIGVSLISSLFLTSALSQGFARLMPSVETYTTSREELVGKIGCALYEVNAGSGAAVVLDNYSNRVQIKCRTEDAESIPRGAKVALMRYEEKSQTFFVRQATEVLDDSLSKQLS